MPYQVTDHIQAILDTLPTTPGVYLHKDKDSKIIYVGKAINLRNRVRSYFQLNVDSYKTHRLRQNIADIEIITTDSELEALLLEMTLIKKHKPRYNVLLKDDKRYPYIKVHWQDNFPKITVTRHMEQDGGRYFGPYTSTWAVYQSLEMLRHIFPYLSCDRTITGKDERACLYYDIKRCLGPCIGAVNRQQYRQMIQQLIAFLDGESESILQELQQKMIQAAEELDFERAASHRDQLKAVQQITEKQKVISAANTDQDVVAFAREQGDACVQIFFIRHGKLIGREYFLLDGTEGENESEILQNFLTQYYDEAAYIPKEVLLPHEVDEARVIEQWLHRKRGAKVSIQVPRQGQEQELVEMVARNATDTLNLLRQQWATDRSKHVLAMSELQEALKLPHPPARIECYDISHNQGKFTAASMVVFVQGVPRKSDYRKFNIQTVTNDDYGAMREVLSRRFQRYQEATSGELHDPSRVGKKEKELGWAILPDLLIVDGGKGQLQVAVEVLEKFDLMGEVPVTALAKQEEELFRPGQAHSVYLPRRSEALYMVQRVRDEAHRFANEHRKQRSKVGVASILDTIPGVGPKRRKLLLDRFGSLEEIKSATMEELVTVPGISADLAKEIKGFLG